MTTKRKPKKKLAKRKPRVRSAVTGEWATEAEAKAKPREHVRERVKRERVAWRGWVSRQPSGSLVLEAQMGTPLLYLENERAEADFDGEAVRARLVLEE